MNGDRRAGRLVSAFKAESPGLIAIARMIASGLALAGAPLIARGIGPDGRGQTSAAMAAFYLVPIILGLGVPTEARRLAAISEVGPVISAVRRFCVLLFLPSILVAWLLCATVLAELSPEVRWVAFIGLALAPAYVSILTSESILIATGRFRHVFALILIPSLVVFSATLVLFVGRWMTPALVLAAAVLGAVGTAVYGQVVVSLSKRGGQAGRVPLVKSSLKFAGSAIAEAASNRLDQLIAVAVIGAHEAGFYAVAVTVSVFPLHFAHSFSASTFTEIARLRDGVRRLVEAESMRVTNLVCLSLSVALALCSPLLIPLVFGRDFSSAIGPTCVALVGGWLACLVYVASMILAAEGRGAVLTGTQVAGLVLGLTLFISIGPQLGALGAAIASTLASGAVLAVLVWQLRLSLPSLMPRRGDATKARHLITRSSDSWAA